MVFLWHVDKMAGQERRETIEDGLSKPLIQISLISVYDGKDIFSRYFIRAVKKLNFVIEPPKSPRGVLDNLVMISFSLPPMGERWREATERGFFSGQVYTIKDLSQYFYYLTQTIPAPS